MVLHNSNRKKKIKRHGNKTPYEVKWKREFRGTLVPFGCEAWYLAEPEDRDKCDARSRRGIAYAYDGDEGLYILDFECLKNGEWVSTSTRDYQAVRNVFPFKEIVPTGADDYQGLTFKGRELLPGNAGSYLDKHGRSRCSDCHKIITNEPLSCKKCVEGNTNHRGRPGPGCAKSRCPGHPQIAEDDDDEEEERPLVRGRPADPWGTRRIRSKTPPPSSPQAEQQPAATPDQVPAFVLPEPDLFIPQPPRLGTGRKRIEKFLGHFAYSGHHYEDNVYLQKNQDTFQDQMDREREAAYEDLRKVARAIGLVTRLVHKDSYEIRSDPDAKAAQDSEMDQLRTTNAVDVHNIYEYEWVKNHIDEARFLQGMLLTHIKGEEDPITKVWKA